MVSTTGKNDKASKPSVQARIIHQVDSGYLRLVRMEELDAEFKRQTRRLARMVNKLKNTKIG
jgi:hypothetical protein